MAFNPVDFLKNLVPDDANMFGASPNANMRKMAEMGLLGDANYEDMLAKANKQSVFQGLLNTGLAYAAQPKNQGYGSIFPYLAKAGLAGVQAAQSPFDQMGKDAMMNQQLEEMQRTKNIRVAQQKYKDELTPPGNRVAVDFNQTVPFAPGRIPSLQDDTIGSSLMNNIGYNPKMLPNGQIAPTEVAPDFKVENINPIDALNFGVSKKQIPGITEVAPDPILQDMYNRYKLGIINNSEFMEERKEYKNSMKPEYKEEDPTKNIVKYVNGERVVVKKGTLKKEKANYGVLVASKSQQLYGKAPTELTQLEFDKVAKMVKNDKIELVKQEGGAAAQGKAMVEFDKFLQDNGDVAYDRLQDLNQLEALLANVPDGGFGEETFTKYQGALQNLGFLEDELIGNKQASIAVSNRLAKALRKAGEGVMTDADFRVLKESVPGLGQSAEGRKILIDAIRKTSQRQIDVSRMANEYVLRNGMLDAKFRQQLQNYRTENPVFSKEYLDNLKNTYGSGTKVETDKKTINKEDQNLLDKYS